MKKSSKRTLWILLAILLVGALVAWTVVKNKNKKAGLAVEYGEVVTRDIEERVSASGRIFPVVEVAISSDVSGEVVELKVAEGDSVRAGELLARVDADAYESQVARGRASLDASRANVANAEASVEQARATRKQQEAQLLLAKSALQRAEKLKSEGLISDAELEEASNTVRVLEANLEATDATIRAAQQSTRAAEFNVKSQAATLSELSTNLRRTNIISPMTGIVSQLNVEQGERVVGTMQMAGTEMARIADLSQMEVQVEVSENDIPRVTLGDAVDIEVDAYLDRIFKGKVTEISNSANNLSSAAGITSLTSDQVTNFVVKILINPASYQDLVTPTRPFPFRPGMSAAVDILTESAEDVVAVPIAAVTAREKDEDDDRASRNADDDLLTVVWEVLNDTVAMREVKTGIQDRDYIQILSGLAPGATIVVGPYGAVSRKLDSGDTVHEQEEDDDDEEQYADDE